MKPNYPNSQPIAIRSLQSAHHAAHIPPTILHVTWNLGRRCNYDCSYCSPHIHDSISPHLSLDSVKNFLPLLDQWARANSKTIQFNLTGGEPFVNPDILEILSSIRSVQSCSEQLTVCTNGSLPLKLYLDALEWVTNLTISIHLERPQHEIDRVIDTIIQLNQQKEKFINVNLLCVATEFDRMQYVKKILDQNLVKYVLRRVRPNFDENGNLYRPHQRLKNKTYALMPISQQADKKNVYKTLRSERLSQLYTDYYSESELNWLHENIPDVWYQNLGVWFEDGSYVEGNSDDLLTRDLTVFKGWACWAGIDQIYVEFDGTIYRGYCANDGAIGNIKDLEINFPNSHTVCSKATCSSNPDIIVRKSQNPGFDFLTPEAKSYK